MKILIHDMPRMDNCFLYIMSIKNNEFIMSSTNTANVIERVLNSKTIFNYLFVTKFPITKVSNGCFGFECDIGVRQTQTADLQTRRFADLHFL